MFTLLDTAATRKAKDYFNSSYADRDIYLKPIVRPVINATPDKELWICFMGFLQADINFNKPWGVFNLIPLKGVVYVIKGPDAIAGVSPHDSVRAMKKLTETVSSLVDLYPDYSLNIFSISAGTYPGFYFANTLRARRLIAVAPGHRMGAGIFTSTFSEPLRKKIIAAGCASAESYDEVIAPYNQENNIVNLPTDGNLLIFGGRCDRVIRNWGTRAIVAECQKGGKNPRFRNYWLLDHISLGGWLSFANKIGLDPYQTA